MEIIHTSISNNILLAWGTLIVAFAILAKSADLFVESAVMLAERFKIPKLVIGIVLVSIATSLPELTVSLVAALRGKPEMAIGNAVGSVICNEGIALALAGIISFSAIAVEPKLFRLTALFLITSQVLTFLFVLNGYTIYRWEGAVLLTLLAMYIVFFYSKQKKMSQRETAGIEEREKMIETKSGKSLGISLLIFVAALIGIILSSESVVTSSTAIAHWMKIPQSFIALTIIALGTSLPEISTSIVAARRGHGEIALGNILGSDILNICLVIGVSAVANPLTLGRNEALFMFPSMFVIVGAMLIMLKSGYKLTRKKGFALLALYGVYIISFVVIFRV